MKYTFTALALLIFVSAPSAGAITIDGTRDAEYGPAIAVQSIQTGFGNATNPSGLGGGGELDAAYAVVRGGQLQVMITGNIENNFNKLSLFFDSKPGGENVLSGTPEYDYEHISQNFGGLTFDSGFEADYHLYARWGSLTGSTFTVDIVDRAGGTSATVTGNGSFSSTGAGTGIQTGVVETTDLGLGSTGVGEVRNLTPFLTSPLEFGFNNTNTAGVGGNGGASANTAAALAVTTGLEFSISLADLGNPTPGSEIKLHAAYGNGNNNYHSNQTLGPLPVGSGNLGGNGSGGSIGSLAGVDFNDFSGNQYFSITVPDPADYNYDGNVDGADYTVWLTALGQTGTGLAADGNANGVVDEADYDVWKTNFSAPLNSATGSVQSGDIPEPCSALLMVIASTGIILSRHAR